MADIKISQLASEIHLSATDVTPIVSNGVTKKTTMQAIQDFTIGTEDNSELGADVSTQINTLNQITESKADADDVESEIQTLTKEVDTIVNDLSAKNILINNANNYSSQGVSFVVNADKTVNVTASPSTANTTIYLNTGFEIKPGTYKLSAMPKDFDGGYQKAQVYVQYRNSQDVWADLIWHDRGMNNAGDEIHTFSEPTFIRVALIVYSGKTYDFVVKPMIYPSDIVNDDYVQFAMTNRELSESDVTITPETGITIDYNCIKRVGKIVALNFRFTIASDFTIDANAKIATINPIPASSDASMLIPTATTWNGANGGLLTITKNTGDIKLVTNDFTAGNSYVVNATYVCD